MDWKTVPVFMMDFEGSPASGVVEYGVVRLEAGGIVEVRTDLCRPVGAISYRDREVHGLGEKTLEMRAPFHENYALFSELRKNGIFAAHNRHAENTFLKDTWPIPPRVPDWREPVGTQTQEWGPWIDTLAIYRALYGGLDSYGLQELVGLFSLREKLEGLAEQHCPVGRRKAHCALYDALASALLLLRLEEEPELNGQVSLGWFLRLSHQRESQQELF